LVATQVGLPEIEVDAVLTSGRYCYAVRVDEAQALAYGISDVPFFVIDDRCGMSGAQTRRHRPALAGQSLFQAFATHPRDFRGLRAVL